jgi:Na+/H+ antiporter NhaA
VLRRCVQLASEVHRRFAVVLGLEARIGRRTGTLLHGVLAATALIGVVLVVYGRLDTASLVTLYLVTTMFVGQVESKYAALALLCLGGFAHQTLSITVITMSSDLFRKNEVATVAGVGGLCGNLGILLFSGAARLAGARLAQGLRVADLVVIGITAAIGFTVSLFFATAAFPGGAALAETKMGALLSFGAAPLALVASRLLRVRARLPD